jgi:glycosyltransferase involved in cell wall biosynthesis
MLFINALYHPYVGSGVEVVLKSLVEGLRIQDNQWKYIKNSAVFVLSSFQEGFSLVSYEELVCGVPVVATRWGGVAEIIKDRENGLLVEVRDIVCLAKAIKMVMKNVNPRKKLIENGS